MATQVQCLCPCVCTPWEPVMRARLLAFGMPTLLSAGAVCCCCVMVLCAASQMLVCNRHLTFDHVKHFLDAVQAVPWLHYCILHVDELAVDVRNRCKGVPCVVYWIVGGWNAWHSMIRVQGSFGDFHAVGCILCGWGCPRSDFAGWWAPFWIQTSRCAPPSSADWCWCSAPKRVWMRSSQRWKT